MADLARPSSVVECDPAITIESDQHPRSRNRMGVGDKGLDVGVIEQAIDDLWLAMLWPLGVDRISKQGDRSTVAVGDRYPQIGVVPEYMPGDVTLDPTFGLSNGSRRDLELEPVVVVESFHRFRIQSGGVARQTSRPPTGTLQKRARSAIAK